MVAALSPALEVRNLTKTYGKGDSLFTALKDVNVSIARGESVAIVGKSGSGKSTLMHLLALMDSPTEGAVEVLGKETSALSKKKLDALRNQTFGFVFQQFFLNGRSTVLENVILPLKIAGVGKKERELRGMRALEEVELSEKAKNRANDLSGGQKQRVVIARALINEPSILYADEPTGNLDSTTGALIEAILFSLHRDKGITLVIVTHDPELAAKCDRRISVKDGIIAAEGATV